MSDANFQDFQNPYAAPYAEVGVKPEIAGPVVSFRGYAGFWIRFVALIIDGFAFGIPLRLLSRGAAFGMMSAGMDISSPGYLILSNIFTILVSMAYYAGMESSSYQGTLGKMALGLKVVDLQGRRISFGRAAGRYLASILSGLILLIGYIMVAFTERKQGLHDMIAGTLVIKTR